MPARRPQTIVILWPDPVRAGLMAARCILIVMARLVRATCRGTVLTQFARTSRAMTIMQNLRIGETRLFALMVPDPRITVHPHSIDLIGRSARGHRRSARPSPCRA
jgi:hypothetical protein